MNRIIKYRAWHKNRECFVPIEAHFGFDTNGELYQTDGKPIELMQSTGLKDKNGVEIYEGDIIVFDSLPKVKVYIEWRKENAGFHFGDWYENCFPYTNTDATIIGNIYENPELLDK